MRDTPARPNTLSTMPVRTYHVYILASRYRVLYVGCTSALARRIAQHRARMFRGFTSRYNVTRLVYLEETNDVRVAIARERQIKGSTRCRKLALIESTNPRWRDLARDYFA